MAWSTSLAQPPEGVLWSSPALYNGSIYEGVASWNDCPSVVPGKLFRVDAVTGSVKAVYSPEPLNCIGAGIWSSPTVDGADNAMYVTTGNDTCNSSIQDSIVQLDATTFSMESSWQAPPSPEVDDADFGSTPTLFTASVSGQTESLVGGGSKNGMFYAFNRQNLSAVPVWSYPAEDAATLANQNCSSNTISSAAWAGSGSPVVVAGLTNGGASCVGTLAALDPATGHPLWITDVQAPILGAVSEAPGLVAVGAGTYLDVLDASSGAILYEYGEPETVPNSGDGYGEPCWFWAPPSFTEAGVVAGNEDGTLRYFEP